MFELSNEQRRQLIDAQQVFAGLRPASAQLAGLCRLRWQNSGGQRYLYEVRGRVRKSLGPQSEELERYKAEQDKKRLDLEARVMGLKERVEKMAPVNRALGLGRVPKIAAKILRELDREGLLGEHLVVAGTNALFGYETLAGVQIASEYIATGDADLIWDTSKVLALAGTGIRKEGLIGLLRRIDQSFVADYGFNARNKDGYIVDLLCPESEGFPTMKKTQGDVAATPMEGIAWLLGAPRDEVTVIGEDGLPLRIVIPEAVTFALHKLWLSNKQDRDALKRPRDLAQARVVRDIASTYLGRSLDVGEMIWLPGELKVQMVDLGKV